MERDAELLIVSDFMNTGVRALDASTPIEDAVKQLRRWGYSGAPVLRDGKLVGVLSEMDCMRMLSRAAYHATPEGTVGDHMTAEVDVLSPTQDIFMAAGLFERTRHRRFPVMEGERLVGIVTLRDIDRALWDMTQKRHARRANTHPAGAAWDEEKSRRRDKTR